MFIYTAGRRCGKTGKMIEWFLADPARRVIVVPNIQQANDLIKRIQSSMGKEYPFLNHIVPYHLAGNFLLGQSKAYEVGIENLDMVLNQMFRQSTVFATVTGVQFNAPRRKPWWKFWSR